MINYPELLSCPFCELSAVGRINYTDEGAWIECNYCKAVTGVEVSYEKAIRRWNEHQWRFNK